jgi:hypothetical protein
MECVCSSLVWATKSFDFRSGEAVDDVVEGGGCNVYVPKKRCFVDNDWGCKSSIPDECSKTMSRVEDRSAEVLYAVDDDDVIRCVYGEESCACVVGE